MLLTGFNKIAEVINNTPDPSYAKEYDKMMKMKYLSKPVKLITSTFTGDVCTYNNEIYSAGVNFSSEWKRKSYIEQQDTTIEKTYSITLYNKMEIVDGVYSEKSPTRSYYHNGILDSIKDNLTKEEIIATLCNVKIECENGKQYDLNSYKNNL